MGEFEPPIDIFYLGQNMKRLCEAHHLSQLRAAGRAELKGRHWQKMKNGLGNPTMETVVRVSLALRTNLLTLFTPPKE